MAEPCYAWTLANGERTDAGHHLALGQMAMAHDALVAILGLEIGMQAEGIGDLGLDRPGEQSTGPVAQDFRELVVEGSWLNQSDDVIIGHGISLVWSFFCQEGRARRAIFFFFSPSSSHSLV